MILSDVKTIVGLGKIDAPLYDLGMFWGGVPGLSEDWVGNRKLIKSRM